MIKFYRIEISLNLIMSVFNKIVNKSVTWVQTGRQDLYFLWLPTYRTHLVTLFLRVFIYDSINDAFSCSDCISSNGRMINEW
jgi:hypothetical protein